LISCKDFLRELNDYLDEGVDPATKKHWQEHVDECLNCFVIVDTTKKTMQVYKGMEEQQLPVDIKSRLMEALERKMAGRKSAQQ
jgi:hypothetical protein